MRVHAEVLSVGAELSEVGSVARGAGHAITSKTVEVATSQDSYRYEVSYGKNGLIDGAQSWRYDAELDETTFTRFGADGKQLSRFVKSPLLGMEFQYDDKDDLVYTSHIVDDGKFIERYWYGSDGKPESSVMIDVAANTHTLTIYQPGIGDWVQVTPYAGPEGWVGQSVQPPEVV